MTGRVELEGLLSRRAELRLTFTVLLFELRVDYTLCLSVETREEDGFILKTLFVLLVE